MGANNIYHIYVNINKLHLHLHQFFDLDSYSYDLAQYPVLNITHNYLEYSNHTDMNWVKERRMLKTHVVW